MPGSLEMLWFDDNRKRTFAEKAELAVQHFEEKYKLPVQSIILSTKDHVIGPIIVKSGMTGHGIVVYYNNKVHKHHMVVNSRLTREPISSRLTRER